MGCINGHLKHHCNYTLNYSPIYDLTSIAPKEVLSMKWSPRTTGASIVLVLNIISYLLIPFLL